MSLLGTHPHKALSKFQNFFYNLPLHYIYIVEPFVHGSNRQSKATPRSPTASSYLNKILKRRKWRAATSCEWKNASDRRSWSRAMATSSSANFRNSVAFRVSTYCCARLYVYCSAKMLEKFIMNLAKNAYKICQALEFRLFRGTLSAFNGSKSNKIVSHS